MSKNAIEVEGFETLVKLIKKLDDKQKKREMVALLGAMANPTLKVVRDQMPVSTGIIRIGNKRYQRKTRMVGKTVIEKDSFTPGYGQKTIAKKTMRKTPNAVVMVGPRSRKDKDGYYLRQWVIPGTIKFDGDDFVTRAYEMTKGQITADGERRFQKYIQRKINKLFNA